ncbi:MAG: response regulator [Oscillospiraceae bacterium]|nr:response regulator [Oscillospiraceae bacterium]
MVKIFTRVKNAIVRYTFSDETPLRVRLFNIIVDICLVLCTFATVVTFAQESTVFSRAAIVVTWLVVLFLAIWPNFTGRYRAGSFMLLIIVCDLLFPFIFFSTNGLGSGIMMYMLFGSFIIFLLLDGKDCIIMAAVYLAIVLACIYVSYRYPDLVIKFDDELTVYTDNAYTMVFCSVATGLIVKFQGKVYNDARRHAEEASSAKADFLSNMSHEMRTPMNAIIGMTAIGRAAPDIDRKNYSFGKIEEASSHLLGVINDILDMSKIEANKLELSYSEFNFEKLLQKVVNVINFRIEEKEQNFSVYIDRHIPRSLVGDDQRLTQVITNLLSNAVKFTPEHGYIKLRALLESESELEYTLRIEVVDSGIGISQEQQSRLFGSFQQAESNTSRKFGGTGLGLAISKRIVEMMGGRIWIDSEIGKGSTFAFTVNCGRGEAHERSGLLNPGVNWRNIRVLAVDDSEDILEFFTDTAAGLGITCDVASSGEDAAAAIRDNGAYDIYFVDWRMPGMDGVELSRLIKEVSEAQSVVIMISAAEWGAIASDAKAAGVDRFMPKPLFPSMIADCINECLGVEAASSEAETDADERDSISFKGSRLLVAEDVEINREIVMALLEPTLVEIECAENGAEAVRMFGASPERYDLIFMDVQMPELDGYEATRAIRALDFPRAREVPIVAMTANVFREDIERCIAAGMNDHIGKPLNFDEVLEKLEQYLKR